ncbi:hypothetical protein MHYP_G00003110 [Metynnis hypsauchen]
MQLKPFALFLFALQWMDVASGGTGPPASCCQRAFKTKMNVTQIVAYIHQDLPLCPIKAVRFLTTNGHSICSDPESHWTKWAIQLVDTRNSTQAPPEDLSFTSDNPQQELIIIPEYTNDDPMVTRHSSGIGPPAGCCSKITHIKVTVTMILHYVHQDTALCPVRAVRFTTITHNVICSDPESDWAKFVMCVLDTRKSTKEAESTCRGLRAGSWTRPPSMNTTILPTSTQMKTTYPPYYNISSLVSTKTQNPSATSTAITAVSTETPEVTRLPWTLRSLKKKSKSGMRKAQRRRH